MTEQLCKRLSGTKDEIYKYFEKFSKFSEIFNGQLAGELFNYTLNDCDINLQLDKLENKNGGKDEMVFLIEFVNSVNGALEWRFAKYYIHFII